MIADRMSKIDSSGIRKVFDLAANMKNPINLSIGQPDFDVHHTVKKSACQAIENGFNKYTPTQGIPELRDKVTENLKKQNRLANRDDDITMITSGTSGGLLLSIMTLVNAGDEVMFTDPYFVMYKHFVNLIGGKPVYIDTYPDFALTAARVEKYITDKTKMLIVNSPCNPTAAVYPNDELKAIAELCNKRGIWIISDEIYSSFSYDEEFASIFPFAENGILLDGFSKSHAMTGWRVGFARGNKNVIQEMCKLQQYTYVCAPSMAQKAALDALDVDISDIVVSYKKKRDIVYENLKDKFELVKPGGAFYAFVKAPGENATVFVEKAIANNVLIIPGSVFSERDTHFRISFAADDEIIKKGMDILNGLV